LTPARLRPGWKGAARHRYYPRSPAIGPERLGAARGRR
jgi:hypothetical protein